MFAFDTTAHVIVAFSLGLVSPMTEMTKSPLSGVGVRWRMMECVRASGYLTHFTLHSNFAPELNKRALGVLLCIYNNRLLCICILHGKPRRTDAKMLMSKIPLKSVLRRNSWTHESDLVSFAS